MAAESGIVEEQNINSLATIKFRQNTERPFIETFINGSWAVLGIAASLELFFFFNETVLFALSCVLLNWYMATKFVLLPQKFKYHPLSTFVILGFCITQFYFPLLFTLIEGKPIVYNLKYPIEVFLNLILVFFVTMVVHNLYCSYSTANKRPRKNSILTQVGLFTPPSESQIWVMGIMGLLSSLVLMFGLVSNVVLSKFFQGFNAFTYAPYFIPISQLFGGKYILGKSFSTKLTVYTVAIFGLSIIANSRGAFMFGLTAFGFSYLLGSLMGTFPAKIFTTRNVTIGAVLIWALTGPLADLGLAMLAVRNQRDEVSPSELLTLTWEAFNDKELLHQLKLDSKEELTRDWDETYLDNIFLSRFCNLKYNDNSIDNAKKLPDDNSAAIRKVQIDKVWSNFPTPVLTALNIQVDKKEMSRGTIGDFLYYYSSGGDSEAIGSFRTGNFIGSGLAAFGYWYLLILGIAMLPVFFLFDKLSTAVKIPGNLTGRPGATVTHISLCGLLIIMAIFQFLLIEGVLEIFNFSIRGWIQIVFLYTVSFHFTKMVSRFKFS